MDIIESPDSELIWAGTERDSAGEGAHRASKGPFHFNLEAVHRAFLCYSLQTCTNASHVSPVSFDMHALFHSKILKLRDGYLNWHRTIFYKE